jgi:hypothetical protein
VHEPRIQAKSDWGEVSVNELCWEIKVSLWRNRLIRNQLCLAFGLPFGALVIVLILIKAYQGLILIGLLVVLGGLLVYLVFRGTYDVRFVLNEKGISCQTQGAQRKRVRRISALTVLMGLLKGNASAIAIGVASGAGTDARIPWKAIRKVRFCDGGRTILLRAGFGEALAVFCTEENRSEVTRLIRELAKVYPRSDG